MKRQPVTKWERRQFEDGDLQKAYDRARRHASVVLTTTQAVIDELKMRGRVLDNAAEALAMAEEKLARVRHVVDGDDLRAAEVERILAGVHEMREAIARAEEVGRFAEGEQVYFLAEDAAEYLKIGFSASSAATRKASCQTGNPRPLKVVAVMQGGRDLEKKIHRLFRAEHAIGEWFRVSPRLGAFVLEVRAGGDVGWMLG